MKMHVLVPLLCLGYARALVPPAAGRTRGRLPSVLRSAPPDEPFFATPSPKSLTQRIMESTSDAQSGGAGGRSTWDAFTAAEAGWENLRQSRPFEYDGAWPARTQGGVPPPRPFVSDDATLGPPVAWEALRAAAAPGGGGMEYDAVVCGGTLGIFVGAALQARGVKVLVVEGGPLRGREQEWNISMDELLEMVELGVLTQEDVDDAVTTEFPGCRSGFKNREETPLRGGYFSNGETGYETYTAAVLNLGVSPTVLIERAAERFKAAGGTVMEYTRIGGIVVSDSAGAAVDLGDKGTVTARLVLDAMGNGSPISAQQRYGKKPDGVCCVVGSCAGGYDRKTNTLGDIIYTNGQIQDKGSNGNLQYFWEAFPVGIGRNGVDPGTSDVKTTYMFTYLDADAERPPLSDLMDDYWRLLPEYQPSISDPEKDLDVKRVLFAYFPTYRDSPLQPAWGRVLAVGDASGIQSPLSFGGFGALTRHLGRISGAVTEALEGDLLSKEYLGEINAYTPNLSAAWMFQKAMSVKVGQRVDPKFVNRLLAVNFEVMDGMGDKTIRPFLQDVIRADGLLGSLFNTFLADPAFTPQIIKHVGIPALVDWVGHVSMIIAYTGLHGVVSPLLEYYLKGSVTDPREQFRWRRRMEAWKFGSGMDYKFGN